MMTGINPKGSARQELAEYMRSLLAMGHGRIALVALLVMLGTVTEAFGIVLIIPVLGYAFGGSGATANFPFASAVNPLLAAIPAHQRLFALMALFLLLLAIRAVVTWQRDLRMMYLSNDLLDSWRLRLIRAVAAAPWRQLQTLRHSQIEFALAGEISRLSTGSDRLLRGSVAAVQLLFLAALAFRMSAVLAAIAILVAVAGLPLLLPLLRAARQYGEDLSGHGAKRHNIFSDFLAGMKLAKAYDAEGRYIAEFSAQGELMRSRAIRFFDAQLRSQNAFQLAGGLAAAVILLMGINVMHTPMSVLSALLLLLTRIISPIQMLAQGVQAMLTMLPAVGHLVEIERALTAPAANRADHVATATASAPARSGPAALTLQGIGLSLPGRDEPVLRDASAQIGAGDLVALLGPSGSGKTTLADVVLGLVEPDGGSVLVDGAPLKSDADRAAFRRQTSYVPQDPFLLDDTLRRNLLWAKTDADDAELWEALAQAEAADFIRALPLGLETPVGNRGSRLSGGERQRICLARALLTRPRLLILDEATNALDRAVEDRLLKTLVHLRGAVTLLMITHRLPEDCPADQILQLENGVLHQLSGGRPG